MLSGAGVQRSGTPAESKHPDLSTIATARDFSLHQNDPSKRWVLDSPFFSASIALRLRGPDALLPCPSRHLVDSDLPQELRGILGQHGIDEHPGAELEPCHARETRYHADIPMKVPCTAIFRRTAANGEIQIGILQPNIDLGQKRSQNSRQF